MDTMRVLAVMRLVLLEGREIEDIASSWIFLVQLHPTYIQVSNTMLRLSMPHCMPSIHACSLVKSMLQNR